MIHKDISHCLKEIFFNNNLSVRVIFNSLASLFTNTIPIMINTISMIEAIIAHISTGGYPILTVHGSTYRKPRNAKILGSENASRI